MRQQNIGFRKQKIKGDDRLLDDFKMIVHKFPIETEKINIYAIGDVHVGSGQFNENIALDKINSILKDPIGYVVYCGDMMDMGIKTAKTNTYEQTMMPHEQKEYVAEMYKPLACRTLAGVPGNHCYRGMEVVGINPMYDIFCRWGIEDLYRENAAIIKINLGQKKNKKQVSYAGVITHGASTNKHHKFCTGFDGADFFISGHTHTPSYMPKGKIRIDLHNELVRRVGYKEIVVDSTSDYGGYGVRKQYEVNAPCELQTLTLFGDYKHMDFSSKEMNY